MSSTDASERDPIDLLSEQFLQRRRRGERLSVEAFAAEHTEHRETLLELLPTLLALEQLKRDRESTGSGRSRFVVPTLTQVGDFRIVRELGRGGMGVVFEAEQESLGRKVALKVLPQASLLTGNQLERFRREAHIAAQLHHSNIVPVFGSGESEGYHWYAMQFITGQSLDRWRQEQAACRPTGSGAWQARARFLARLAVQAASALHYAHSEGTLHRDVKPANLLLEGNDHLWVTDFGLAKALEAEGLTHSGDLLGTLQYMAPEQFVGRYDVRSEVYALGVTLYELLVLRPAFVAKTRSELMETIRTQRPESLRRLCPEVPEDLVIVVEKAMAADPGDRYADTQALQQDLQAFLEDRPIAARRQNVGRTVLRWCRRNRALATLAVCTLLAVVGAGITGWVAYGVTRDALGKEKLSAQLAARQWERAENNLQRTLTSYGGIFDALVGRDPALALDEDPDTGEQTVISRPVVEPRDVDLLNQMIAFYHEFAADNAESQALRFETARASRRVGAIHARLGRAENLEAAAKAYEQALSYLEGITDRDVRRETAAVHVDFGQLEQRRRDFSAAALQFREALRLLDSEPPADSKALRFERAQTHFLLARNFVGRPPTHRGAAAGNRPPEDRARDAERSRPNPRVPDPRVPEPRVPEPRMAELRTALQLVTALLVEEPDNQKFRALRARCLLQSSRPRRPDAPDRPGGAAREQTEAVARAEGLQIFRELVEKYPDADQYRLELCEALLADSRQEGPAPRLRRDGPGGRDPTTVADVDLLREAKGHADRLVQEQPWFQEYRALQGRTGSLLGRLLRERSDVVPAPEREALLQEAEAELRAALRVELALVDGGELTDPRFARQVIETRRNLGELLLGKGDRTGALDEGRAMVELLTKLVDLLEKDAGAAGPSRFGMADDGPLPRFDTFLRSLEAPELRQPLRVVRERLQKILRPDRPDRPGPPPGPERGGK